MTNEEAIVVLAEALNDVEAIDYGSAKLTKMMQRKEAIKQAIAALRNQPRWIPCSERLPKDFDYYLVTCEEDDLDDGPSVRIAYAYYRVTGGWPKVLNVTAWMPLPEPYRG